MAALPRPVVIRYGKSFMWGEAGDAFERGFLAMLARSTRLGHLTHLVISRNDIGERGLLAIAESPGLQRLRTISIDDNPGNSVRTRQALKARFQLLASGG